MKRRNTNEGEGGVVSVNGEAAEKSDNGKLIRALVVDDNLINQTIHKRMLRSLGIENQVVGNGKEAIDIHSCGKMFDLILMDLDMPIMNGIEVFMLNH